MADLYVMQNDHGLIKIGRGRDVERRRRALQSTDACRIEIVAIIPGAGDREEETHIALEEYRIIGEWFAGGISAKAAIERHLHLNVCWPFALAANEVIECWLDELEELRFLKSRSREFGRLISHMASIPGGDPANFFDVHIWVLLGRFADEERAEQEEAPTYTTDVSAALSVWPDNQRPSVWLGSAWDCCIAGLIARKASFASTVPDDQSLPEIDP